jgi:hypothetical protein|tara:strand:+ start:867 stop:1115 length:249 start_codon:yes stop_codon:yes gene_type:complete
MSKQLSEKEVSLLKSYQQRNSDIIFSLGNIELNKMVQNEQKEELFKVFKELQKEQNNTAKELEEKYGSGSINLETKEIISKN